MATGSSILGIGHDEITSRRNVLEQGISSAIKSHTDRIIEIDREDGILCGSQEIYRLETIPPEAISKIANLKMFETNPVLADCLGVFSDVDIVEDSILLKYDEPLVSKKYIPGYLHSVYQTNPKYKTAISSHLSREVVRIEGPVFVPFHPWCKIYGHFLLESLPRLAIVRYMYALGLSFPIYIDADSPKFISDYLALAVPDAKIIRGEKGKIYGAEAALIPNLDHPLEMARLTSRRLRFIEDLIASCYASQKERKAP